MDRRRHGTIAVVALLALVGCHRPPGPGGTSPGFSDVTPPSPTLVANPLAGQPAAIEAGKVLFVQMNCAGCHGYDLKGGTMAPDLTDRYWRYGGTPAQIYASIANGRPKGMPSWRTALPPGDIWRLVSYIQSQGGTTPPAQFQAGEQGDLAGQPVTPPAGSGPADSPALTRSTQP
jgi:mono/diheme cytochrome c family protein